MSFHDVVDTDDLVLKPVIKRTVPVLATPLPEGIPPSPCWADYLIHAAESAAARSGRAGTDVDLGPAPKAAAGVLIKPDGAPAWVLDQLRECKDPLGIEGSELWVRFQDAHPEWTRKALANALTRLEAAGLIQSFPSVAGGNRKRFRALPTGGSAS